MTAAPDRGRAVLLVLIERREVVTSRCVRQVEPSACQPLIKEPDPAGVRPRRGGADHFLDRPGAGRKEQPLENGEIEAFVLQSKGEMTRESRLGRMPRRQYLPAVAADDSVVLTGCGQRPRKRHLQVERGQ